MARRNRFAPPGYWLHLTQRGNYRQTVFSSDADREHFFSLLETHHKFQCRALFRGRRAIKSARTTIRPLANRDKPSDIPTRVPFDIDVERILGVEGATLMTVRDELHRIVDELPDAELFELRHIVDDLKSGMEAEESVGAESLTAIQEGLADLKAGRTVNWETVKHENGL